MKKDVNKNKWSIKKKRSRMQRERKDKLRK